MDLFDAGVNAFVWIGASDARVEGHWQWEAGPERGQLLSYTNWGPVEPNNDGDEDVAAINLGPLSAGGTANGQWGDTKTFVLLPGYILEYEICRVGKNEAPVVSALTLPSAPIPLGTVAMVDGSFTDSCPDDAHTAEIGWDDGTTTSATVTEADGTGTASGSHLFSAPGVYTVTLTVDDGDASGSRLSAQDVPGYIVVYDPSAGFVTGGGWFESPPGACSGIWAGCVRDGSTTGKATFGFTSRYHKGATIPSGHTAFHFSAGDLRFSSTSYDWLVIAGAQAKYKGIGTINGAGDYGFQLTAIDGALLGGDEPDRIRIKLWDRAGGGVVYDNTGLAQKDPDTDAAIELGAGNIVIQRK